MVRSAFLSCLLLLAACSGSGRDPVDPGDASDTRNRQEIRSGCRLGPCDMFDDDSADSSVAPDGQDALRQDGADLAADTGENDVAADLASDAPGDLGPDVLPDIAPDVPPDVELDLPPLETAAFRVNALTLSEPEFCLPMGDACIPLLGEINTMLGNSIVMDGELNLVGSFVPFKLEEPLTLSLGQALCNFEAVTVDGIPPMSCKFDPATTPANFENVTIVSSGGCEGGLAAPCFVTGEADFALEFSDVVLGLSNATVSAGVASWPPGGDLQEGTIHGWLPEEIAKSVVVNVGGMVPMPTLYDLLKDCPTEPKVVDGHNAWPVTLHFAAPQIGFVD